MEDSIKALMLTTRSKVRENLYGPMGGATKDSGKMESRTAEVCI